MIRIKNKIEDIKNDYKSGSTQIAKKAVRILGEASKQAETIADIIPVGRALIRSKPTMAAIYSVIEKSLERYKMDGKFDAEDIVNIMKYARKVTVSNAVDYIIDNHRRPYTFITCSYSSTVNEFIKKLSNYGSVIVYCLESLSNDLDYGRITMEELVKHKIDARYIDMKNVAELIKRVSFSISGADMIVKEEGVINGVPSRYLAVKSKKYIPYYVIGESFKRSIEEVARKAKRTEGFELIEEKYIANIFRDDIFNPY